LSKKRFVPLAVAVALVAVLAATFGGTSTAGQQTVRVGLVSDVGRFNDKSFNQSALEGLRRAQRVLKVQGRAVESRAASDYIANLSNLARQNYSPTIGVGFLLADGVNTVARQFPNSRFAIIDYSVKAPPFTGTSAG
jgi:basic membrane protein A